MYKVIIVDDERLVREDIKIVLREENLPVDIRGEARNGQEAYELICADIPDIVITDIRMPVMDGITLIRKVKSLSKAVRFIIISGFAEFEYARNAVELGAMDYVLKPINNEKLVKAFEKAFDEIEEKQQIEQENIGIRMEKSLNALLFQQEQSADICGRLSRLIPELANVYCLLGIFHIDHPKTYDSCFTKDDFDLLRFSVKNILEDICRNYIHFYNFRDKTEILVLYYDRVEQRVSGDGAGFIHKLYSKIKSVIPISLTVGISGVHKDISNLGKCYEEAKTVLNRRFVTGSGKFYTQGDLKAVSQIESHFPEHKIQTFRLCLERLDTARGTREIEKIIMDIFTDDYLKQSVPLRLKILFTEVVKSIAVFCERMELNISDFIDESVASGDILADFSNSSDIAKFVADLVSSIMENSKAAAGDINVLVRRIVEYMKNNFSREISLETIARENNINVKYLSRVFKNITGKNFSYYLSDIRLNKAKEMLEKTQLSICDIAIGVGYSDHQYFHKVFKKYFNVTPNEYRLMKSGECNQQVDKFQ